MTLRTRLNDTGRNRRLITLASVVIGILIAPAAAQARRSVVDIVAEIQRADYEGNRAALKALYDELKPFAGGADRASRTGTVASKSGRAARVHYWLGFAPWRRALNGFNESVDHAELEKDLELAETEFDHASAGDPAFVDAKVGAASCFANLAAISYFQKQMKPARALLDRSNQLLQEAERAAPDNPRMLWVLGANLWYRPVSQGGGQAKAIETYERGLKAARKNRPRHQDPLQPSWGEPELLMNLAWSNLNSTTPNLEAAESYAQSALKLVPYWHYVRDILIPQIRARERPR